MDSLVTAAARALAAGDPLGALNRVALRDDPPALALRGIAMSQLGDLERARLLLRRAGKAFGPREAVARARCALAEAEIALVLRDLDAPATALEKAATTLAAHGDAGNAAHARYLMARRLLLIGRIDAAEAHLRGLDEAALPPASRVGCALVQAGLAMRRLEAKNARDALARAEAGAMAAGIAGLSAEVAAVALALDTPAARLTGRGGERLLLLDDVEALLASDRFVIDACRNVVRHRGTAIALETRPVLLALARILGESWPGDAGRLQLVAGAFRGKQADESHRARLRVEIGRLRRTLKPVAAIVATEAGFRLVPHGADDVAVIAPPIEDRHAAVLALLADGEAWSSSALALALGMSQRQAQRALDDLRRDGKVQAFGFGRARRWLTPPVPGFPTALLLPAVLPAR
jgi:hypothetical protein